MTETWKINNQSERTISSVCKNQLDIPVHKIKYALVHGLLNGAFESLENYGIKLNNTSFNIFYDVVSEKLSGSPEVEYEWSEDEYNAMMQIRSKYCN